MRLLSPQLSFQARYTHSFPSETSYHVHYYHWYSFCFVMLCNDLAVLKPIIGNFLLIFFPFFCTMAWSVELSPRMLTILFQFARGSGWGMRPPIPFNAFLILPKPLSFSYKRKSFSKKKISFETFIKVFFFFKTLNLSIRLLYICKGFKLHSSFKLSKTLHLIRSRQEIMYLILFSRESFI